MSTHTIRFAPTGVETETEFMTLLMRDKENKKLGKYEHIVTTVRGFYGEIPELSEKNFIVRSRRGNTRSYGVSTNYPSW